MFIGAGILVAFWGGRLLRTIYILGFLVVGAAEGFKIGASLGIDTLIGLTFGAGITAFIGYLFFRWWVGVTTGVVAVLLVLLVAWPRVQEMEQAYQDHRAGVGTGDFTGLLAEAGDTQTPGKHLVGFSSYLWSQQRDFARRLVFALGLAGILGMVLGLMLPKFTIILGTSFIGVLSAAGGTGVLVWRNWPEVWKAVAAHPEWCLVGMGAMLVVSMWHQVRPGRIKLVAPAAPPAEAPAASAASK
jgi:hypothetical protein